MFLALALATALTADDPTVEQELEDERLYRIGASVLGGGLGIAAPLLVGLALQSLETPCSPTGFGCSSGGPMAAMVSLLPVTFGVGLGVSHSVRGGRAGVGFGFAGGLAGYMTALSALGLVSAASHSDWAFNAPGPGAGLITAFSLLGAVAAMELRNSELQARAPEWRLGRGLAEGAVFWLAAAPLEAAIMAGAFLTNSTEGALLVATFGTLGTLLAASAAAWGTHRGMDGRGKYWPVMIGALAGAVLGAGFMALHAHAPPAGGVFGFSFNYTTIPLTVFACLIGMVGPTVALEWSSSLNSVGVYSPPEEIEWQVQGGFGPNGGTVGLSGRF